MMHEGMRSAEDEMVRRAIAKMPPMSGDAFAAGRATLLARIGETGARPGPAVARRSRRAVWLMSAAAVAALVAGILAGPSFLRTNTGDGPEPGAVAEPAAVTAVADLLLRASAAPTGDVVLKPGQYLYVLDRTLVMSSADDCLNPCIEWAYLTDETYQTWVPGDPAQDWMQRRTSSGVKKWLKGTPADLVGMPQDLVLGEWKAVDGNYFGPMKPSFENPTPAYLATLPRNPRQLYAALRAQAGSSQPAAILQVVSGGLESGLIPADMRKAVYRALTYLPSLRVIGKATDLDGRPGVALGVADSETNSWTDEIIINPTTGQYLGFRTVATADWDGIKSGTVIGNSAVTTKVVGGLGQTR
jgi:hypothetical protein